MDAPRTSLPPVLPPHQPVPSPSRLPGLRGALGLIAVYFLLQMATGFLAALLLGLGHRLLHPGMPADLPTLIAQPDVSSALVIVTLCGAALGTLWLARTRWPELWSRAEPPGFGFVAPATVYCVAAVALGVLLPLVGGKLTEWLAHGHAVPQDVKQLGSGAGTGLRIALTLAVATIGPVAEELLFRGVLLSALLRRMRAVRAVAVSAVLFALVHLPDLRWLWYAVPNLALLGAALAWLRLRSGSLWPAVIAHACNNLLAMLAMFVSLHQPG
ncbi:CPBP family intramembrane glutamic endopeptidase [Rhodanobacter sp. PCA2]|uniref:CPBP family intramembrane glutamic endopeptidase n=1 Tax=Rhodanobacter sp. PCA2 TaxID=2006117 RepID=UPI0015E798CA|nr:CPBP family intramembrane glutamic endopeptidase [Rhodanobacter sp. PCA2]MBA2077958.1 CPBP family intramembrane metalloprotease [Rhodanobacter sp. PCA2]